MECLRTHTSYLRFARPRLWVHSGWERWHSRHGCDGRGKREQLEGNMSNSVRTPALAWRGHGNAVIAKWWRGWRTYVAYMLCYVAHAVPGVYAHTP